MMLSSNEILILDESLTGTTEGVSLSSLNRSRRSMGSTTEATSLFLQGQDAWKELVEKGGSSGSKVDEEEEEEEEEEVSSSGKEVRESSEEEEEDTYSCCSSSTTTSLSANVNEEEDLEKLEEESRIHSKEAEETKLDLFKPSPISESLRHIERAYDEKCRQIETLTKVREETEKREEEARAELEIFLDKVMKLEEEIGDLRSGKLELEGENSKLKEEMIKLKQEMRRKDDLLATSDKISVGLYNIMMRAKGELEECERLAPALRSVSSSYSTSSETDVDVEEEDEEGSDEDEEESQEHGEEESSVSKEESEGSELEEVGREEEGEALFGDETIIVRDVVTSDSEQLEALDNEEEEVYDQAIAGNVQVEQGALRREEGLPIGQGEPGVELEGGEGRHQAENREDPKEGKDSTSVDIVQVEKGVDEDGRESIS